MPRTNYENQSIMGVQIAGTYAVGYKKRKSSVQTVFYHFVTPLQGAFTTLPTAQVK